MFEPIQALAATCVREYPVDRPPQLRFLAGLVTEDLNVRPNERNRSEPRMV